ncbi:MAG TPA: HAD hydrolase-like protein [Bryobacteraceae bacterium]|nr:HAD hydrolase-like protein [Bryobacteraceae bacterium]
MKSNALVLFDIDGTLLRRAGPHHREALVDAVRDVTGLETTTDHIPVHGMLDPDILSRMMRDAGASAACIRRNLPAIMRRAQSIYLRRCPDLQKKTCPGVRRLLYGLQRRRVPVGLVTGNLTRIGWKKMEQAALRHYFRFGMFAEMAPDRTRLARMAIEHARRARWIDASSQVSLIGDAPSDIIAAHANGARAVAVHTGISTREELAALQPDLLVEDLRAIRVDMLL